MYSKLADLHKQSFPYKPWTAEDFKSLKNSGVEIICSENGFIVWRVIADEAEIITIGVIPDERNSGIGTALLILAEVDIKKKGAMKIFLEVAENNTAARILYERNGYTQIGIRPKYYDSKTDAIVMEKKL